MARSLLGATRSAVGTLRTVLRDMASDGVAVDLQGEVRATLADLESALAGDGGGLAVDARPATLGDGLGAPWCVWRAGPGDGGGAPDLPQAFAALVAYMGADPAVRHAGAVFNGQPNDGARVICRVDLEGLADVG